MDMLYLPRPSFTSSFEASSSCPTGNLCTTISFVLHAQPSRGAINPICCDLLRCYDCQLYLTILRKSCGSLSCMRRFTDGRDNQNSHSRPVRYLCHKFRNRLGHCVSGCPLSSPQTTANRFLQIERNDVDGFSKRSFS